MPAKCFGEFMGTLIPILLGDGLLANDAKTNSAWRLIRRGFWPSSLYLRD
jgi:glycerol uptake facilitator-like aquaporin